MKIVLLPVCAALLIAACEKHLVCPQGETDCGGRCTSLLTDPASCGACGAACAPADVCDAGTCGPAVRTDALVGCYWTDEVVPVASTLAVSGPVVSTGSSGPQAIAMLGGTAYAGTGYPAARLVGFPLGASAPSVSVSLPGSDLSAVVAHGGLLFVANASVGTIEVLDPAGAVLDEVPLPQQAYYPNPRSIAFVGSRAYVVLSSPPGIQELARIDFSNLSACAAPDPAAPACGQGLPACAADRRCAGGACRMRCGEVDGEIALAVTGATDGAAVPSPEGIAAVGSRLFVPLANLENATVTCDGFTFTWYVKPAGNGRLAVVDTASADAVSIVDLGPGCKAPAEIAVDGSRVWVSCGSMCFSGDAPGAFVAVDVSGETPIVGTPTPLAPVVGGAIAVCNGRGFVADVRKTGLVVPFDAASGAAGNGVAVCGFDAYSNSLASAVTCAE